MKRKTYFPLRFAPLFVTLRHILKRYEEHPFCCRFAEVRVTISQ
jgi:hypothetical protein